MIMCQKSSRGNSPTAPELDSNWLIFHLKPTAEISADFNIIKGSFWLQRKVEHRAEHKDRHKENYYDIRSTDPSLLIGSDQLIPKLRLYRIESEKMIRSNNFD